MSRTHYLATVGFISIMAAMAACSATPADKKKIFVFGWETQLPPHIRERMDIYEASPFHGQVFGAKIPRQIKGPDGNDMRLDWLTWGGDLNDSDFEQAIIDLAARPQSKHNELFIRFNCTPGADWFDDEAFERTVTDNWRRVGRMVREARLPGILFDPEHYRAFPKVFSIEFANQSGQYSIPECLDMAYRRGREVILALNEEVVDLEVLTLLAHMWKDWLPFRTQVAVRDYRMLPPFLDGMLSAKSEKTRIHDVWEGAYRYKHRWEFERAYALIHGPEAASESLVPEVYLDNILVGFGIWICDNKELWDLGNPYYTPEELEKSLQYAFELTDHYVWLYHEQITPWALNGSQKFPDDYWESLVKATRPYGASVVDYSNRQKPNTEASESHNDAKLVGHWPLSQSIKNTIEGGGVLLADRIGDFERIDGQSQDLLDFDNKWPFGLSIPRDELPSSLGDEATVSVLAWPVESGTLYYTILSGALSKTGPVFELAMAGDGTRMRFEITMFDSVSGEPIGWQKTGFYYDPQKVYRISMLFKDGAFMGLYVNRHQAIFGLWDLQKRDLKIRPCQAALDTFNIGRSGWDPRLATGRFKGKIGDLRLYKGLLSREEILGLSTKP